MTATLTYTLVLAAIYFGIKAIEVIEQKDWTGQPSIVCRSLFLRLYKLKFPKPIRCAKWHSDTRSTPNPYFMLRLKLMEEASSKYFVGQVTSAIS